MSRRFTGDSGCAVNLGETFPTGFTFWPRGKLDQKVLPDKND